MKNMEMADKSDVQATSAEASEAQESSVAQAPIDQAMDSSGNVEEPVSEMDKE